MGGDSGHAGVSAVAGTSSAAFVTGWMYMNQRGQMCGPYVQEQLYGGLDTGFLPQELSVYPVMMNGNFGNPVPLGYFKQFPEHVASGFVCMNARVEDYTSYAYVSNQRISLPGGVDGDFSVCVDEYCWLLEDGAGAKHGPYSLTALYSWCQYGFIGNSLTPVHDMEKDEALVHSESYQNPLALMENSLQVLVQMEVKGIQEKSLH
ncbi:hypothetical protein M569_07771 [Genlisea aurea]|uniref:GYF domain-containing protein n=1 Tax=Genlisea aurea TaxID=192259 RepID=S8CJ24_9LAMI|nr:hypothetical protein M569_07771 [Genlisea aurea]